MPSSPSSSLLHPQAMPPLKPSPPLPALRASSASLWGALGLLWGGAAWAQEASDVSVPAVNAQLFRPSIDAGSLLWTDDAARLVSGQATGRLLLSHASAPLVYTFDSGERFEVLSGVTQADLMGGYTLGRLRVGVDVPLYLRAAGEVVEGGSASGLGDVAADLKVSAFPQGERPLGLAFGGRLMVPTSTVDLALGSPGLGWEVQAIVDRHIGPAVLALNVGSRGVPSATLEDLAWNDQLFVRAGGALDLSARAGASAEIAGSFTYAELGDPEATPLEALLGGWLRPGPHNLVVRGGLGTGLSTGVGTPRLRTIFAIAYEPRTGLDTDQDGVVDAFDDCPQEPEDRDGHQDRDGCSDPTLIRLAFSDPTKNNAAIMAPPDLLTINGQPFASGDTLEAGSYDLVVRIAGYRERIERINVPEGESYSLTLPLELIRPGQLRVRVSDPSGQPVPGATWRIGGVEQGTIDQIARLDVMPGTYRISATAGGRLKDSEITQIHAELETIVELVLHPTTVTVTPERLDLGGKIYFQSGDAIIKPESYPLLEDVAQILREYPEIRKIRIEGHTDRNGDDTANQLLSERRAAAVVQYLVDKGIEPSRLRSIGYGESKPVDRRATADADARNRRVDFFVEQWVEETATLQIPTAPLPPAPAP